MGWAGSLALTGVLELEKFLESTLLGG